MRKKGLMVVLGLFGAMAIGSFAWACTGQPQVFGISPQSGATGIEVKVEGQMISGGPVEIRWNGQGISEGLKLADSFADPAGRFSASVTVPDMAPGVYYITVEGADQGTARASFEVTRETLDAPRDVGLSRSGAPSTSVAGLWTGFETSSGSVPSFESADLSARSASGHGVGLGLVGMGAMGLAAAVVAGYKRRTAAATANKQDLG